MIAMTTNSSMSVKPPRQPLSAAERVAEGACGTDSSRVSAGRDIQHGAVMSNSTVSDFIRSSSNDRAVEIHYNKAYSMSQENLFNFLKIPKIK
jgi:hypothetical protein